MDERVVLRATIRLSGNACLDYAAGWSVVKSVVVLMLMLPTSHSNSHSRGHSFPHQTTNLHKHSIDR